MCVCVCHFKKKNKQTNLNEIGKGKGFDSTPTKIDVCHKISGGKHRVFFMN